MANENPYEPGKATDVKKTVETRPLSSGQAAYNVVSDTVAGLNVRKSDNKFQAIFIAVSVLLLAAAGTVVALMNADWEFPWYGGALTGGFAGLVLGFFASGIYLMIYRTVRHIRGRHD